MPTTAVFTEAELAYLTGERRLARLATVDGDGRPHVTPVGWQLGDGGAFEVRGIDLAATKKFRDVEATGQAALVVDDVLPPWQPRGIEIRGRAEAVDGADAVIRIHPTRIVAWGLDADSGPGSRNARTVQTTLRGDRS